MTAPAHGWVFSWRFGRLACYYQIDQRKVACFQGERTVIFGNGFEECIKATSVHEIFMSRDTFEIFRAIKIQLIFFPTFDSRWSLPSPPS